MLFILIILINNLSNSVEHDIALFIPVSVREMILA